MNNVVPFRQRPIKGLVKRKEVDRWSCMTCKGERFYFEANEGLVECAVCGAFISNLRVVKR